MRLKHLTITHPQHVLSLIKGVVVEVTYYDAHNNKHWDFLVMEFDKHGYLTMGFSAAIYEDVVGYCKYLVEQGYCGILATGNYPGFPEGAITNDDIIYRS